MGRSFLLTAEAESDLTDIYEYIARDSLSRAGQVLARLQEGIRKIAG